MDLKNIAGLVTGIVVCILMLTVIVMPIINVGAIASSDEETYTNESTLYKMGTSDDTITISLSSGTITLNGEAVEKLTSNILISDAFGTDYYYYQNNWLVRTWFEDSTNLGYPSAYNLTFENGQLTGTYTSGGSTSDISMDYTYVYYYDANGDYAQIARSSDYDAYVNSLDEVVLSGIYYTGSLATTYNYTNGELKLANDSYTGTVSFDYDEIGYDVLQIHDVVITISDGENDESFSPFRIFVPVTVIGHTPTPTADLLLMIPLLITVSIILGVVSLAIMRRE